MNNEEEIVKEQEEAWRTFARAFWPDVAYYAAKSKIHHRMIQWLVGDAFKAGMDAGIRMAGNAALREFGLPPMSLRTETAAAEGNTGAPTGTQEARAAITQP